MTNPTNNTGMAITLCRYWVKPGKEPEFKKLLKDHYPTFKRLGLIAEGEPHHIYRGETKDGKVFYVEIWPWANEQAMQRAHSLPEVAAIWEPMGGCCTEMEFPTVEELRI